MKSITLKTDDILHLLKPSWRVRITTKKPLPLGTSLWVKEEWSHSGMPGEFDETHNVFYQADTLDGPGDLDNGLPPKGDGSTWIPASEMPCAASRLNACVFGIKKAEQKSLFGEMREEYEVELMLTNVSSKYMAQGKVY